MGYSPTDGQRYTAPGAGAPPWARTWNLVSMMSSMLAGKLGYQRLPPLDERFGLVRVGRHRQQVTLPVVTTHRDQHLALRVRFDSFRGNVELELLRDADDALDQGELLRRRGDPVDEGFVYLEHVDRQLPQVAEGRIAGTEVVDSQPHPDQLQVREVVVHLFVPVQQDALGELEHQRGRR